jgi:glycosidase
MRFTKRTTIGILLLALTSLSAQTLSKRGWAGSGLTIAPWWQSAILYQIDPVSFQDSKGDGFGDLRGILTRLDYLQSLGVDALLLAPLQSGPAAARANAEQPFDTAYGTPEDLDQLIGDAGRHKIRILVDLPLNGVHTTLETVSVARFWLSRGVAGLRLTLDSADPLTAAQLADQVHELKRLSGTYAGDRVLFWDVQPAAPSPDKPVAVTHHSYASSHLQASTATPSDAAQMTLSAVLEAMPRVDAAALRHALTSLPQSRAGHTFVLATDGSDHPRSFDRYGSGGDEIELAKALATALLASPGAPLLYFGQEIGMATTPAPAADRNGPGAPTPMQWGDAKGFSSGDPWINMGRNAVTANVAAEDADRYSLLNWYRRLTALRHAKAVLREGSVDVLQLSNPSVVAWVRRTKTADAPVVVICNLSAFSASFSIASELHRLGIPGGTGVMHTLAASNSPVSATNADRPDPSYDAPVSINAITLPAYGVYLGELRGQAGLETMPTPVRSRNPSRTGK